MKAVPTPRRLGADIRYRGRGVTMAMVDAGFFPHPDLVRPRNRIRAWVRASRARVMVRRFGARERPRWPGWDERAPSQWHGMMTAAAAAGNGGLSAGRYRGLASEAELVLIDVLDRAGRVTNEALLRALRWLARHVQRLGIRVVNFSVAGDPVEPLKGNPIDAAVADLVARGVTVIAAAGNQGGSGLVPPATAAAAITVGGFHDGSTANAAGRSLWHSSFGRGSSGTRKPELLAPSLHVLAPVLPGSEIAREAQRLFRRRAMGEHSAERVAALKLASAHYQHVEGTSFASAIVASTVACMLEANPELTPSRVRRLLLAAATPLPGVPRSRQGRGALHAGRAVALALSAARGA